MMIAFFTKRHHATAPFPDLQTPIPEHQTCPDAVKHKKSFWSLFKRRTSNTPSTSTFTPSETTLVSTPRVSVSDVVPELELIALDPTSSSAAVLPFSALVPQILSEVVIATSNHQMDDQVVSFVAEYQIMEHPCSNATHRTYSQTDIRNLLGKHVHPMLDFSSPVVYIAVFANRSKGRNPFRRTWIQRLQSWLGKHKHKRNMRAYLRTKDGIQSRL